MGGLISMAIFQESLSNFCSSFLSVVYVFPLSLFRF
jgi:hypothetical protein